MAVARTQIVKATYYNNAALVASAISPTLGTPATAGRALVAAVVVDKLSGAWTTPAGWTLITTISGASVSVGVFGRVAAGGETTGPTISWTNTQAGYVYFFAEYSGVSASPFGPVYAAPYSDTAGTSISLDPPAATAAGLGIAVFGMDTADAAGTFNPSGTGFAYVDGHNDAGLSGIPGVAWEETSAQVTSGQNIAATSFTWTRSDQVAAAVFLLNGAAANAAPTVNAGADQTNLEPWSTVALTFSAADSDGTVVGYSVTQTGGATVVLSSPTLNTRTYAAPGTLAGDTQTFSVTAIDDDGAASAADTVSVTVLPVAERILIGATWTPARLRLVSGGTSVPVDPLPPVDGPVVWPPDPYREAIRNGLTIRYSVAASYAGAPVAGASDLPPVGGTITDTTKPGVRRVLNLELAPDPGLFDLLSPIGTRLSVSAHVRYTNRTTVDIPMGVFDVDSEKLSEGGGGLSLTAPDKWIAIQRARFVGPAASTPGLLVTDQIAALIRGALGVDEVVKVTATSTATVGALTWEKDRDKAILDLAKSIGAWVFFDREGVATIADVPTIGSTADWLIDASPSGVLVDLDRERTRSETRNVVVVESSASDGAKFPTQYVWDNDPGSPTYAGTDPTSPTNVPGPFGVVVEYFDSPILDNAVAARNAGLTILARTTGLASQVSIGSVPNPAIDAFDVIDVLPPKERYDIARVLERHVVDTVTHPLTVGSAQHIDGRSTRTDEFGS